MEQRRYILFIVVSTAIVFGWMRVAPMLFPQMAQRPAPQQAADNADDAPAGVDRNLDADAADEKGDQPDDLLADADRPSAADTPEDAVAEFPHKTVKLGSLDPESGYYMQVVLTTEGAAVETAQLNDPRYRTLDGDNGPLNVVGNNTATSRRTLATAIPQIDAELQKYGLTLETVDWNIVDGSLSENSVTFEYPAPDGKWIVRKEYSLAKGDPESRDENPEGYLLSFDLTIENRTGDRAQASYDLQGPVGLPLEDADNARTFIEVKLGALEDSRDPNDVTAISLTADEVVEQTAKARANNDPTVIDAWRDPLRYIGVDVQYFAALILPGRDQLVDSDGDGTPDQYFVEAHPVLVSKAGHQERSDISVVMTSRPIELADGEAVTDTFEVFLGPKRTRLLEPFGADGIITFGWFPFISVAMLKLMNFFHYQLYLPYALSIILLTVIVRGAMFPISSKQDLGAQKMKEIQPKLQELKKKHSNEPEKFLKEQGELFRKHNYHPLSGCLPALLQLPIFIGLYNALYNAVDLRMAGFLWIDNLAAPDALFPLGFTVPFLGWTEFNVLPIITVGLFLVQQKMFMPPPTTEEQELQQKMMNYMMVFFGALFYRVPAGLCIYFIASSSWGIAERKLLEKFAPPPKTPDATVDAKADRDDPEKPRKPGLL
ncbi:MAG: membrane protein insertase YidC, partial [Maioricimonas sp. JB049]